MKVAIGGDHAGFERKEVLTKWLIESGHSVKDLGTHTTDSVDYPDYAHAVAEEVAEGESELGVLICGSANGVAITANKHQGVRAGIAWIPEIAALARQHNNANICCIPSRFVSEDESVAILKAFFEAEFEGGRHERRVNKIACS